MKRKKSSGDTQSGSLAIQDRADNSKAVVYGEYVCPYCSYFEVIPVEAIPVCPGRCNYSRMMKLNENF